MRRDEKIAFSGVLQAAKAREARGIVVRHLKELGYKIKRAGRNKDRGLDIFAQAGAKTIGISLKVHSKRLGHADVHKLRGIQEEIRLSEVWLISTKGFTEDALEVADDTRVVCLDAAGVANLRPASGVRSLVSVA